MPAYPMSLTNQVSPDNIVNAVASEMFSNN